MKLLETGRAVNHLRKLTKCSPARYFKTNPKSIRFAVMLYVQFPFSLRNVEDILHGCGIDVSYETILFW